jgi:HKD family nuclease
MAKKEFILQGITARTHADVVRELFAVDDIKRVLLSVAYVTESGVRQIESELKTHAAHVIVFAGIRNGVTTHQALTRLHSIKGLTLYTVDTGSRNVVFHPKFYLVRGAYSARFAIGSANLTTGGLRGNIEAGLLLQMNLKDRADNFVTNQIETMLAALPTDHPKNVIKIETLAELDAFLASGLIEDEALYSPPQSHPPAGGTGEAANVPQINLKTKGSGLLTTKPLIVPKSSIPTAKAAPSADKSSARRYVLVWQSKPLRPSNINIFTSATASKKNVLSLGQGSWATTLDFQSYFRIALKWAIGNGWYR